MSETQPSIGDLLAATVPMARTLCLEFGEITPDCAVVRLPDQADFHNHVGGPHAGAARPERVVGGRAWGDRW